MNVTVLEGIWFGACLFGGGFIVRNLLDAYRNWRSVQGTSRAWRIQAWANLRREIISLVVIACLTIMIVPFLFLPGETAFHPLVIAFLAVPIGTALNSYLDARTRRTLARLVAEK